MSAALYGNCVYLKLKQNIIIRENLNTSLVYLIFTFGRKKHFILLFKLFHQNKNLSAFPVRNVLVARSFWEACSVEIHIQDICALSIIGLEF